MVACRGDEHEFRAHGGARGLPQGIIANTRAHKPHHARSGSSGGSGGSSGSSWQGGAERGDPGDFNKSTATNDFAAPTTATSTAAAAARPAPDTATCTDGSDDADEEEGVGREGGGREGCCDHVCCSACGVCIIAQLRAVAVGEVTLALRGSWA